MANFKKDLQKLKVDQLKAGQMKEWNAQGDNKTADTRLWRCGCGGCFRCGGCGGCFGCFGCFFWF